MSKLWGKLSDIDVAPTEDHHVVAGSPLYQRTFDHVLKFHLPGVAPVRDSTGAFHITTEGEDLYSHRFKKAFGFYENFAAVQSEEGWFHIDVSGNPLYEERYHWCGNFQEGLCSVQDKDGFYFHINSLGKRVYEETYLYVGDFKEGIAVVHEDKGVTHIDKRGALVHDHWFRDLDVFHKGFARACDDKGWHHITKKGLPLSEKRFSSVEPFYNGLARVIDYGGNPLLFDEEGKEFPLIKGRNETTFSQKKVCLQKPSKEALRAKAFQELSDNFVGFWAFEVIKKSLNLGLLDLLPGSASMLSNRLPIDQEVLQRFLRALEEIKIVERGKTGIYALTMKGSLLCPTQESPMAAATFLWEDSQKEWQKRNFLKDSLHSHQTFKENCQEREKIILYRRALEGYAQKDFLDIHHLIDWTSHDQVLGLGYVSFICLQIILRHHKHLTGAYYDKDVLMNQVDLPDSLGGRVFKRGLNFFEEDWPTNCFDSILLPRFLHYFPDTEAYFLLLKAKTKLKRKGKIYIFEMLLSEETPAGGLLDLNMFVESGGKLRKLPQLEALLTAADLKITSLQEIQPHLQLVIAEACDE